MSPSSQVNMSPSTQLWVTQFKIVHHVKIKSLTFIQINLASKKAKNLATGPDVKSLSRPLFPGQLATLSSLSALYFYY